MPLLRSAAILIVGATATVLFAVFLNGHNPIRQWFFLDIGRIWLWCLYLSAACASFGHIVLCRFVAPEDRTPLETLALSFPIGLVGFVVSMYLGGFLALYGSVFAVALPLVMLLSGLRPGLRALREGLAGADGVRGLPLLMSAFGILCLGILYLGAMTPDAVNHDGGWNHLVIAQDYAREGRIVPFPGDWVKDLPHLGSIVNTWAFLVPGFATQQLHWTIAMHLEITVFIWTLAGVAVAARWIAGRETPALWAAYFLFPGIFVYDGNLGASADHFMAVFVAPLVLMWTKAMRRFDRGACLLTGALAGACFLTKVHAIFIVTPIAVFSIIRIAPLLIARVRDRAGDATASSRSLATAGRGLLIMGGAAFAVFALHLGRNLWFYKNPLYPLLQEVFTASSPTVKDAPLQINYLFKSWWAQPPAALGERILAALGMVFTFSFTPHYTFMGALPTFGSLFTLSLLFLPFIEPKDAKRLWLAAALGVGSLFTWAFTYWVDRYLQTFLPLLAAVTAAIILRVWEQGRLARIGLSALVLLQVVWGGDLYFSGSDRIQSSIAMIRSGLDHRANQRMEQVRRNYLDIGAALPKKAVVFLHTFHVMLGINRRVICDWTGFQGLIDYQLFKTPRDLYDRMRALGITHVVYQPTGDSASSRKEEIIFDAFRAWATAGAPARAFGDLYLFDLPPSPPPATVYTALLVGMPNYADGLYPVDQLSTCEDFPPQLKHYAPPLDAAPESFSLLARANVVLVGSQIGIDAAANEQLLRDYRQVASYRAFRVLLRNEL